MNKLKRIALNIIAEQLTEQEIGTFFAVLEAANRQFQASCS